MQFERDPASLKDTIGENWYMGWTWISRCIFRARSNSTKWETKTSCSKAKPHALTGLDLAEAKTRQWRCCSGYRHRAKGARRPK
ncbi:MAG: hypothetical protein WDM87_00475 [Terracidiphilus sp.]